MYGETRLRWYVRRVLVRRLWLHGFKEKIYPPVLQYFDTQKCEWKPVHTYTETVEVEPFNLCPR